MSAPSGIGPQSPWPYPFWIAHRGAGKLAPENTLAAFRLGAAHGYRAFECDVKLSADGVPFLLHDTTLDRTTPERGRAADRSWSELSQLDAGGWHSRAYAGEPPASLAGLARWVRRNRFTLNIEIKPTPGHARETGAAVAHAVQALWGPLQGDAPGAAAGGEPWPLLSSFRPEALAAAQAAAPQLPRALLLDTLWPQWLAVARSLDCVAVVTNYELMDAALLATLHGEGWRALCYTVNDAPAAQHLQALGVDGLITDAVDRFSPA